jgi:hypothetical protein
MPYVELNIAKNKINGKSKQIKYKYNSHTMGFETATEEEWAAVRKKQSDVTNDSTQTYPGGPLK